MLVDPHSFANISEIQTSHFHLELTADFIKNILFGSVTLSLVILTEDIQSISLDYGGLAIHKGILDGKEVKIETPEENNLGKKLFIPLEHKYTKGQTLKLQITYETTNESSALQFLTKEQTADKQYAYLFTQCQATHARSLFPCQDCPSIRSTYTAVIHAPSWATALMSALRTGETENTKEMKSFTFEQPTAMPSYLVAIVIGQLERRRLSERSDVWSEPSMVDKAAYEFSQTEEFLVCAEKITSQQYVWKRYDIVCLPPSFPFGGMENPCLTFVTPTLLAGDRSLATVIAHEIAHSWTGNLITNRTWEHFWLNEGWTMMLERKITTMFLGKSAYFDFAAMIGWRELKESVDEFGETHNFTALVPNIKGIDPDDSFSSVPYEKGFNFLYFLASCVGWSNFDLFLQAYIKQFRYQTIDTIEFCGFFLSCFSLSHPKFPSMKVTTPFQLTDKQKEAVNSIEWDQWFYGHGMPPVTPSYDTTLAETSDALARKCIQGDISGIGETDITGWSATEVIYMLGKVLDDVENTNQPLTLAILEKMDASYHFTMSKNADIRFRWYLICIRSRYTPILNHVVSFLKEQGRMKYVRPLYRELAQTKEWGYPIAIETFEYQKDMYHPIAKKMIAKDFDAMNEVLPN